MEHYEQNNLRFWPLESMTRFGQNPYGENLWRIVHAPSRRSLVHGQGRKPKWLPTYPQAGNAWVLEKWLSAYEFTKCTTETWNMSLTLLGPYPERGEYELAHIFNPMPMGEVDKIITLINAGKRHSANENKNSMRADMDKQEKDRKSYWHDRLMECTHAYGTAPISSQRVSRGTKTRDFQIAAQQTGLPTQAGHMRIQQGQKQYDVSELIQA